MVETIRLESGHTLTGIVGSNPTLSASFLCLLAVDLSIEYFSCRLSGGLGLAGAGVGSSLCRGQVAAAEYAAHG